MQHNKDYAISLYACVARSASCEWLIISLCKYRKRSILSGKAIKQTTEFHEFCASGNDLFFRRGNERDENDVKRG